MTNHEVTELQDEVSTKIRYISIQVSSAPGYNGAADDDEHNTICEVPEVQKEEM